MHHPCTPGTIVDVVAVVTSKPKSRFFNFSIPHIVAATIVVAYSLSPSTYPSFVCGNGNKEENERRRLFARQSDDLCPLPITIHIRWLEADVSCPQASFIIKLILMFCLASQWPWCVRAIYIHIVIFERVPPKTCTVYIYTKKSSCEAAQPMAEK